MATNGASLTIMFAPADVVAATATMRGKDTEAKKKAHEYLEKFQKSKDAWNTSFLILKSAMEPDVQLFAAITLRGKITYDLGTQLQPAELLPLRTEIILLLNHFATGHKPIRVALSVCLAILAIQMPDWSNVISDVVLALGADVQSHTCILDFVKVLPEEINGSRKIPLSEEEHANRANELLANNVDQVLQLLLNYSQLSPTAARNPLLIDCITAWLGEIPIGVIVRSPLLDIIFDGVAHDETIQAAAECLCSVFGDANSVDENQELIEILFPRVMALVPRVQEAARDGDAETFKALTKIIGKAAYAWAVVIARHPTQFRPLVEAVVDCIGRDKDRDAIEHTFEFWYEFRMYITLERYAHARSELLDLFPRLVDILLDRLQFPSPESGDEDDLFEGDREQEERFREFRHRIGDTLKDAALVMGPAECLAKIATAVRLWMDNHGSSAGAAAGTIASAGPISAGPGSGVGPGPGPAAASVPHWQELEAPLFALRAVGSEIPTDEANVLPRLIPLIVQIPNGHPKLRFAATMVVSRYTEWTSMHPEFLEPQFNYIVASFDWDDKDVIRAAAMAIRYFCTDCPRLLSGQVEQLQRFYNGVLDKLPDMSQEEITQGVAAVVAVQPADKIYQLLKLYCDPLLVRLMTMANAATTDESKRALADRIQLLTIFVANVQPAVERDQDNPAVAYWREVFPVLVTIVENFGSSVPVLERVCRCWRTMVLSYRTAMTPLLGDLATKLAAGFEATKEGCFLWVTATIIREFSEHRENVNPHITEIIYAFFEQQTVSFLRVMTAAARPGDLPDVIEDFFRLITDALLYYPHRLIPSGLLTPIFEAATYSLVLEQRNPVESTLHFLRDLLAWGGTNPPSSGHDLSPAIMSQIRHIVTQLVGAHGEKLMKQIVSGLVFTFDEDCYSNATGVLVSIIEVVPQPAVVWLRHSLEALPAGTVTPSEVDQLMDRIQENAVAGDERSHRPIRLAVDNFAYNYRRRHVSPRDGLGQLDPTRFSYSG